MKEHICKLCGLQKTLHTLAELISDMDFSNTLLTFLSSSWSTFLTAINAGLPSLTLDVLLVCILEEDRSGKMGPGRESTLRVQEKQGRTVPRKQIVITVDGRDIGCEIVGLKGVPRKDKPPSGGSWENQTKYQTKLSKPKRKHPMPKILILFVLLLNQTRSIVLRHKSKNKL